MIHFNDSFYTILQSYMKFVLLILCEKFKMAKRAGAENQFCVLPRKSIKLLAERVGISNLSSEVAASLAEDASYRIRQSVQVFI